MSASTPRPLPKFVVRLPTDAKLWLETEARRNGSSQNSEVVRAIRERIDRLSIAGPLSLTSEG